MANLGIARANDAWRTAGKLWMALEPMGHARRCCHRGFDARRLLARESAEYEMVRRPATSTVVGVRAATLCGCWRRSAEGACLAELAKREDSCLNIIVLPSASDGDILVGAGCEMQIDCFVPLNVILQFAKVGTTEVWLRASKRDVSGHMSIRLSPSTSAAKARLPSPASLRVHANNTRRPHFPRP